MSCPIEEWKSVVGFENVYRVSDQGRVQRIETSRILKPTTTTRGYAIVNLTDAARGLRRCSHVYNVVTAAFLGPKPPGMQVNHIDGVKTNNALRNLEYVTARENQSHAIRTGLRMRELTPEDVREVRALKGHLGCIRAGKLLGVSKSTVDAIWRGEYYSDVE